MSLLNVLVRQQELVRTLLRGEDVEADDLLLLAEPLPAGPASPADVAELLRLQAQADELERLLAQRMAKLRAQREAAVPAQAPGSRFLDTAL